MRDCCLNLLVVCLLMIAWVISCSFSCVFLVFGFWFGLVFILVGWLFVVCIHCLLLLLGLADAGC